MGNVNVGTAATQLDSGSNAVITVKNTGTKDVVITPGGYTLSAGSQIDVTTNSAAVSARALRPGTQATVDVVAKSVTSNLPTEQRVQKVANLSCPVGSTDHAVTWKTALPSTSYEVVAGIEGGALATAGCTAHYKTGTATTAGCTVTVVNQSGGTVAAGTGFVTAIATTNYR